MAAGNGYPKSVVQGFVQEIEELDKERETLHAQYMQKCAKINEQKGDIYDAAKEKGLPKKALRAVVKARAAEKRAERIRSDLEGDEQDQFDLLRMALGDLADTELGEAARARMAARQKENEDALDKVGRGASH